MEKIMTLVKSTPNWVLFFLGAFLLYLTARIAKN